MFFKSLETHKVKDLKTETVFVHILHPNGVVVSDEKR